MLVRWEVLLFCTLPITHGRISSWAIWSSLLIDRASFPSFCRVSPISPQYSGSITPMDTSFLTLNCSILWLIQSVQEAFDSNTSWNSTYQSFSKLTFRYRVKIQSGGLRSSLERANFLIVSEWKSILWICTFGRVTFIKRISDFLIGPLFKILRAEFRSCNFYTSPLQV